MKQLTYVEPGRVEWQDAPIPSIDDGGVLVRPLAVARCDLDLPMAAFGLFPGPFPVGHETVAQIVEVGGAVTRWQPGDRVIVPFQISCGACDQCGASRFAGCRPVRASAGAALEAVDLDLQVEATGSHAWPRTARPRSRLTTWLAGLVPKALS